MRERDGYQEGAFPPACGNSREPGGIERLGQVADTQIGGRMMARSPFLIATKPTLLRKCVDPPKKRLFVYIKVSLIYFLVFTAIVNGIFFFFVHLRILSCISPFC